MSGYHRGLILSRSNLLHNTVGISFGNIEEVSLPCGLIMGAGSIHHVTEIIELMTQHLLLRPSCLSRPAVRLVRVDGAGGIEIAVRLLCSSHDGYHTVDIAFQSLVGVSLEHIACTLNGLIHIGIIEAEAHERGHVIRFGLQSGMTRMLQCISSLGEVAVPILCLTFAKGKWNSHLSCCLYPVSPKGGWGHFHGSEGYLTVRIAVTRCFLFSRGGKGKCSCHSPCSPSFYLLHNSCF